MLWMNHNELNKKARFEFNYKVFSFFFCHSWLGKAQSGVVIKKISFKITTRILFAFFCLATELGIVARVQAFLFLAFNWIILEFSLLFFSPSVNVFNHNEGFNFTKILSRKTPLKDDKTSSREIVRRDRLSWIGSREISIKSFEFCKHNRSFLAHWLSAARNRTRATKSLTYKLYRRIKIWMLKNFIWELRR